jgi:hypothetical protein
LAKKKVTKKRTTKTGAKPTAKTATKTKVPAKKKAARKVVKKASRSKQPKKKAPKRSRTPTQKPNERLETMAITIEPQESGDLIVTESGGGSIQVHHTVHPDAETTPIPGKSYDDLHELGSGTHEIEIKRTVGPSDAIA